MKVKMAGDDYSVSMVTFDCGFGLVSFMLGTLQTSDEDYSADFDKVLQSIEKPVTIYKDNRRCMFYVFYVTVIG